MRRVAEILLDEFHCFSWEVRYCVADRFLEKGNRLLACLIALVDILAICLATPQANEPAARHSMTKHNPVATKYSKLLT